MITIAQGPQQSIAVQASRPLAAADPTQPVEAEFSFTSQDQTVMSADRATVRGVSDTASGLLKTDKVRLGAYLQPNTDGTYVFDASDRASQTAAISFAAASNTIAAFSDALGAPITWAFVKPRLEIAPDEGEKLNAYYDRDGASLSFFHGLDPKTNQMVMSGASGEIVSHETGHAILDGLRPGYLYAWTFDVWAFHESFGDLTAMLMAMHDDRSVALCAQQTGGDLKKPNCIAASGEELGMAINHKYEQNLTGGDYIRNAINDFKWADPATLPDMAGPEELSKEPHNLSRLWTGAMYDVFAGIQARNMAAGMDAATALKATGAEGLAMVANMMKEAPQSDFTFADMAKALLAADEKYAGGANAALITGVMTDRGILGATPSRTQPRSGARAEDAPETFEGAALTSLTPDGRKPLSEVARPVTVRLSGSEFGMFAGAKVVTLLDNDGPRASTTETAGRVGRTIADLIKAGRIRYNDPGVQMRPEDRFDSHGRPYVGYVRWENGEMVIERSKLLA